MLPDAELIQLMKSVPGAVATGFQYALRDVLELTQSLSLPVLTSSPIARLVNISTHRTEGCNVVGQ
jgi:hypothetical protein